MRDVDHVMDAMVLTQVVPMLPTFQTMLWSRVWEHIHDISQSGGDMQAIVGPLYDNDNDNYRDGEEIIQRYVTVIMRTDRTVIDCASVNDSDQDSSKDVKGDNISTML